MSQVLLIIVIVIGSLLNLLAGPWSSTESLLERRRNDIVAILLWLALSVLVIFTIFSAVAASKSDNAFDLQDWTALVLPFILASPYLLELAATLVRQLEMWRWMRRATVGALPIAWMYRTMTVGEEDDDGQWLRDEDWAPWSIERQGRAGLWRCTSRNATLNKLMSRWIHVLMSAFYFACRGLVTAAREKKWFKVWRSLLVCCLTGILTVVCGMLLTLTFLEIALLIAYDMWWWHDCKVQGYLVARYDTVHFGRQEMQNIFENSIRIKASLNSDVAGLDVNTVHNRIMGAIITTTAVLENSFRCAYLATPVYTYCISNRKALRPLYAFVGCDLDGIIKQVRLLLEKRHTTGLLSITTSIGTAEAALHNNIESILSVSVYFGPGTLYRVASRVAKMERSIEDRISGAKPLDPEQITRERVCYIDARNAMFWLLWIRVAVEWKEPADLWRKAPQDKFDRESVARSDEDFPESTIETMYIIATFLSRCRYCRRYRMGIQEEREFYVEVASLTDTVGAEAVYEMFCEFSDALEVHRGMSLLDWTEKEYELKWTKSRNGGVRNLTCTWQDENGADFSAECDIALRKPRTAAVSATQGRGQLVPQPALETVIALDIDPSITSGGSRVSQAA